MFSISDCKKLEIIGDAAATSSVYLFPFIIEYSIIGIEVIYSMWKHIGKNPRNQIIFNMIKIQTLKISN